MQLPTLLADADSEGVDLCLESRIDSVRRVGPHKTGDGRSLIHGAFYEDNRAS